MEIDSKGKKAGKGALIQTELSGTLGVSQDQTLITSKFCYGIDQQGGKGNASYTKDIAPTLASNSHGTPHGVAYSVEEDKRADSSTYQDKTGTLSPGAHAGSYNGQDVYNDMLIVGVKNE